jgi:Polyketide cyclase / dehydrase and lipid transport
MGQPSEAPSVRPDNPRQEEAELVLHVEVSTVAEAPRQTVLDVYADYQSWPRLFPTISAVRLLGRDGPKLVLEVDHVEGKVINELLVRPPDQLDLWEEKRHYDARFLNRFETVRDGTRFTVHGEIRLKGWARLLQPFLRGYVRRRMQRLQLQPVKAEAEARARPAAEAAMRNQGRSRSAE